MEDKSLAQLIQHMLEELEPGRPRCELRRPDPEMPFYEPEQPYEKLALGCFRKLPARRYG